MDFLKANTCDAVPFPTCMGDTDLTPKEVDQVESGRQDELPVAVFALFIIQKGFVKQYADDCLHVRYRSILFARTL